MDRNITSRNTLLAKKVIAGLESRNMSGYWAENKEEALRKAEAERKAEEERKALEEFMKKSSGTVSGMQSAPAGGQDNSVVSTPPSVPEKGYEKKRYSSDRKKEDNSERPHFRHGFHGKEKGK